MERIPMPARPQPDVIKLNSEDMVYRFIGLCAPCCMNLNSACPIRIGNLNKGIAKDCEGSQVTFPSGNTMLFAPGATIPPGGEWLSEIALTFGRDVTFTDTSGQRMAMFAVTMRDGNYVCEEHNGWKK